MAKKVAAIAGTVTALILSTDYVEGNVALGEDGGVTVTFKKPRSSKYITRRIPAGSFITATEGEDGSVTFFDQTEVVSIDVDDINASVEIDGNVMRVTDTEGEVTVIDLSIPGLTVNVEGEPQDAEGAAPKAKKAPAKAEAPAKGKGKKAVVEDEDEDEDDEDEDEDDEDEDEAPAKGKGKGKKAKAKDEDEAPAKGKGKAKGKAKADDSDWD